MATFDVDVAPASFEWDTQWKTWLANQRRGLKDFFDEPTFGTTIITGETVVQDSVLVEGALEVDEDLSAGNAAFGGEVTVGEDVHVGENLYVNGQIIYGPIDLTNATSDYPLEVGQSARLTISAATTNLRIAVTNGVYEMDASFDDTTFAADHTLNLNPNNTTFTGEFKIIRMVGDTSIATDEYDTATSDLNAHSFSGGSLSPRHFHAKLIINSLISNMMTTASGVTGSTRRMMTVSSTWSSSVAYTSLGTLDIGEAASGVIYIKRIA